MWNGVSRLQATCTLTMKLDSIEAIEDMDEAPVANEEAEALD